MTNDNGDDRIRIPGFGTLTRRGELVFATLVLIVFLLAMAVVGGIELGTL